MRVLVTVGTTRFDALVQEALSEPVIAVLRARGYTELGVQCGESDFDRTHFSTHDGSWVQRLDGVGSIEVWKLRPSLQDEYRKVDLVISHAGASPSQSSSGYTMSHRRVLRSCATPLQARGPFWTCCACTNRSS